MYSSTICAIASGSGASAVSIVRLCGSDSLKLALRLTQRESFAPRYAHLCTIHDANGEPIDQAIVIYFKAPFSFNGEEIVEIQCHGGYMLASMLLRRCEELGARQALPGEFTKLAVLNGKIDLSQAEAIAGLIAAKSEDAVRQLARQLKGSLALLVEEVRSLIIESMAYAETVIDYAEEDLPPDLAAQIVQKLEWLSAKLNRLAAASRARHGVFEGFRVGIVGKPNVGKSSILNSLLRYERAIVSDIAGTTRDTVEESFRIGGHLVRLVDTAGIRESAEPIERIGIERSKVVSEEASIILAVFDLSKEFDEDDGKLVQILKSSPAKNIVAVLNKSDLPTVMELSHIPVDWSIVYCDKHSAAQAIGDELQKILDISADASEEILANVRQVEAIESCAAAVTQSLPPLLDGELELFVFHLREAVGYASALTRPYDNEETLDAMFSSFCLGK